MDTTEYEPHLPLRTSVSPQSRLRTESFRQKHGSEPVGIDRGMSDSNSAIERSGYQTLPREIMSPKPRRHLLDHHELHSRWLPASPLSSRPSSPLVSSLGRTQGNSISATLALYQGSESSSKLPRKARAKSMDLQVGASRGIPRKQSHPLHQQRLAEQETMGRRWVRWMHEHGTGKYIAPVSILAATFIKYCVGLGSYSGQAKPPMFGDYEAQRHWMELTVHLPFSQWYTYDLQYWGLDYPPLTAYHSWLCGQIGSWINPTWFALDSSRGIETVGSKLFMRGTVLVFDLLIYVSAIWMFNNTWQATRSRRTKDTSLLNLLFHPALLLIDFGHFQYNSIMLGLTLFAMNFFAQGRDLIGALFFVLSLGFKQMALYYAPAIGCYLLAKCIYLGHPTGSKLFLQLGLTTVLAFLILFIPFLPPYGNILDPITRIFPFARGLFEDKVANFWCSTNVVFKWRKAFDVPSLIKLSALLTVLGFLPSVALLLNAGIKLSKLHNPSSSSIYTPILPLLPYAMLSCSMSFFLFSFQVHEKTILLPLMPLTLLLSGASKDSIPFSWNILANNVACFSMWPLLKRDGLGVQYIALLLLWNRLVGFDIFQLRIGTFVGILSLAVYTAMFVLHVSELLFAPPSRFPDLFVVLNVLVSAPVFGAIWIWSCKCLLEVSWAIGAMGNLASRNSQNGGPQSERVPESPTATAVRATGQRAHSLGYAQVKARQRFSVQSSVKEYALSGTPSSLKAS